MLRSLNIRNYVLIDSLDIQFPEGLVIITGQTGAGKSILLGALSLLTGAKADAAVISAGADSCVVEGEFEIADEDGSVRNLLEDADVEWDGGHLLVRRVVHSSGRSRSFINDSPVQVQLLGQIAEQLVDIHSQHSSLTLASKPFQMSVLDHYAGLSQPLNDCRVSWSRICKLESQLADTASRLQRLQTEKDYNQAQWEQLDRANLTSGELCELEDEQTRLANAEEIKTGLATACDLLAPGDERTSVSAALKEAARQLQKTARYLPEAAELAARLESARIEIDDLVAETDSLSNGINLSEERLAQVEARISLIYSLFTKHSCRTEAELIAVRDRFGEALFDSDSLESQKHELEKALAAEKAVHAALCSKLSAGRKSAAPALAKAITESVRSLELDKAVFEVAVTPAAPGASGSDSVVFLFSANGNVAPAELGKCASGGELSRIMLSIKALMAKYVGMPTMIFDEIDTGVSGSAAAAMGSVICSMGRDMQVFAITHLPQVAAKGSAHYVVSKTETADGRTVSGIRKVEAEERVTELARLLSGATVTPEALANARALLAEG